MVLFLIVVLLFSMMGLLYRFQVKCTFESLKFASVILTSQENLTDCPLDLVTFGNCLVNSSMVPINNE